MKRTLFVTARAEAEIDQAKEWYRSQSRQAAVRFSEAVDLALETIGFNPEQYQIVYRETRRVLLEDYPYAFFYVVTETQVKVIACIHTSRDPRLWL